jgi:hypothetical protein
LGPDNASNLTFYATVPSTGLSTPASAKVTAGSGTCTTPTQSTVTCTIPSLTACTGTCAVGAAVEVDVTASPTGNLSQIAVNGNVIANGSGTVKSLQQTVQITTFTILANTPTPTITNGQKAVVNITFCPSNPLSGYNAIITPSQSTTPSMVTESAPTFTPTTVTLSGSACGSTTLTIQTVARPITTGSLLHRGSFYAAWLPIGGLSLAGLGIGAGRKRRRWLIAGVLCLVAAIFILQPACGSSSSTTTTNGGTAAGTYTVNVQGSAGSGSSQNQSVQITVF